MKRLVIAIPLVLVACGGKGTGGAGTTTGGGGGDDGPPPVTKQAIVSFGTEAAADHTRAWLVVTDETGAAKSYPLADVPATGCAPAAGGDLDAIGKLECTDPPLRVIVVSRLGDFIILDQRIDTATGEPGEYEEQTRIPVPEGARISFQP